MPSRADVPVHTGPTSSTERAIATGASNAPALIPNSRVCPAHHTGVPGLLFL